VNEAHGARWERLWLERYDAAPKPPERGCPIANMCANIECEVIRLEKSAVKRIHCGLADFVVVVDT
jgi:hypothetical protein